MNHMSDYADNLIKSLQMYDLSSDESKMYLHLLRNGRMSVLQISKNLKIARTKIYRLIDKLASKGMIIERVEGYGRKFEAAPYEKLRDILETKESEVEMLQVSAPQLFNQLAALQMRADEELKVLHYQGVEGLKQVTWNSTKVQDPVFRIYEVGLMHDLVDKGFAEKCRKEYAKFPERKFRQLTNLQSLDHNTEIAEHVA